ncbi:hypothetical protein ACFQV2_06025 [Actinokineospora soli]|uniref:Uncharacterized protein n=1 Tax=Actinokineospora soli TaxID=1048753 RepID=A0ABW2TIA2_9PSEU
MNGKSQTGVRSLRNPDHWMVLPWSPTANVHDLVAHFMRFAPYRDAGDLEHLAYYEAYVAALETAYGRGPEAYWSVVAESWYHELHGSLLDCLEQYRLRCKETENDAEPGRAARRAASPRYSEELPGASTTAHRRRTTR